MPGLRSRMVAHGAILLRLTHLSAHLPIWNGAYPNRTRMSVHSTNVSGNQVTAGSQTIKRNAPSASATINRGSGNNQITVSNLTVPAGTLNLTRSDGNYTDTLVKAGTEVSNAPVFPCPSLNCKKRRSHYAFRDVRGG